MLPFINGPVLLSKKEVDNAQTLVNSLFYVTTKLHITFRIKNDKSNGFFENANFSKSLIL